MVNEELIGSELERLKMYRGNGLSYIIGNASLVGIFGGAMASIYYQSFSKWSVDFFSYKTLISIEAGTILGGILGVYSWKIEKQKIEKKINKLEEKLKRNSKKIIFSIESSESD